MSVSLIPDHPNVPSVNTPHSKTVSGPAAVKTEAPNLDELQKQQSELQRELKVVASSKLDNTTKQERMHEIIQQLTKVNDQITKSHGMSGPPIAINPKDNRDTSNDINIDLIV